MSILHTSSYGWVISHEDYINKIYEKVQNDGLIEKFKIRQEIFKIEQPYKATKNGTAPKRKLKTNEDLDNEFASLQNTVNHVENLYKLIVEEAKHLFQSREMLAIRNSEALETSCQIYEETSKGCLEHIVGENNNDAVRIQLSNNEYFIFPTNCKFYCQNVTYIDKYLNNDIKYDLIVVDPPWWNKYIRRKRLKSEHGYRMMYNDDVGMIPIEKLLSDNGLLVIWCTNSSQHLKALQNKLFLKWKVHLIAKWYWLKVTKSGNPVCTFSIPPNKQPFEQIFIGSKNPNHTLKTESEKVILSIPSALHSHKPPLLDLFETYLPSKANKLELFARYLLPNCSSWGLEALRFQHESLYYKVTA